MNDHIHSEGAGGEHDHGALGDAEYTQFMELAAEEGAVAGLVMVMAGLFNVLVTPAVVVGLLA